MDLALDPTTGDLALDNSDLFFVRDIDAVAQFLWQKHRLFLAEWFLDENSGIPYHDRVFVKNPKGVEIDTIFKNDIMNTPGVIELLEFSATLDGPIRKLSISYKARAKGGIISFNSTFPGLIAGIITLEDGSPLELEDGGNIELET